MSCSNFSINEKVSYTPRVDDIGRIHIPKGIRDDAGISIDDAVTLTLDGNKIIIQKVENS